MNPYQALANAIIELAAKDYRRALKHHYQHPNSKSYTQEVQTLEKFFRSAWYQKLTTLDGEYLMREVRALVRKEVAA